MNFFKEAAKFAADAVSEQLEVHEDKETRSAPPPPPSDVSERSNGAEAMDDSSFESRAKMAIPGLVRMFSGCKDHQTSADVANVSASFTLPEDSGVGGAGGACTAALIECLGEDEDTREGCHLSFVQLLSSMQKTLQDKGYTQVPQLSASRKLDLSEPFMIANQDENGARRSLFIGINYVGQQGELRGCHNDVLAMKKLVARHGFDVNNDEETRVLLDDGAHTSPTANNILQAIRWLVKDAAPGDCLFLHYSGHGGRLPDDGNDEADGYDETLVPLDYASAGQIRDDVIFRELVMPLPEGVTLTAVMDCCHSATVCDLPFISRGDHDQEDAEMHENPGFSFQKMLKIGKRLYAMKMAGADTAAIAKAAAKDLAPMLQHELSANRGGLANMTQFASKFF